APFLTAALAAEGRPVEAALIGSGLAVLAAGKTWAITRKVGLDARRWELGWDVLLHAGTAAGLPMLVHAISSRFGNALSIKAVHGVELAAWWLVAIALAPLAAGLPDLGRARPLGSRRPAAVWRALTFVGVSALTWNGLWIAGSRPALL